VRYVYTQVGDEKVRRNDVLQMVFRHAYVWALQSVNRYTNV
jgi:hypothetical protein